MIGGTLGSFVGIGGGVFTIPIMTSSAFRLTQRQAMASNLVAVMCTGIAGATSYASATGGGAYDTNGGGEESTQPDGKSNSILSVFNTDKNVQFDMAITAAIFGMVTARLGAKMSNNLTEKALKRFLVAVMYIAAPAVHIPELIEQQRISEHIPNPRDEKSAHNQRIQMFSQEYIATRLVPAALIGSTAGVFSGMTGLGGGIITVSAFTLLTPLSYKQALGTSLCAMVFPATSAAISHHFNGNIVWRVAPFLAAGAGVGAWTGGQIGSNLPETELKYCFSAAMIALGTRILLRA
jgi:uncharacterized membrane protein YfcA